jgi:hypothetical protein
VSQVFAYICVRQTADPYIPTIAQDLRRLSRDVSDGFAAMVGGYHRVGELAFFPQQRSVANHLLCNGQEVPKAAFPELYDYLGGLEGAPVDPLNFKLPNFIGTLAPAAAAAAETVVASTVTSETPSAGTGVGGSEDYAVDSGGRFHGLVP